MTFAMENSSGASNTTGKVGDLLRVESDIAREVSQRFAPNIPPTVRNWPRGSTQNPEAYQLYLKGVALHIQVH